MAELERAESKSPRTSGKTKGRPPVELGGGGAAQLVQFVPMYRGGIYFGHLHVFSETREKPQHLNPKKTLNPETREFSPVTFYP